MKQLVLSKRAGECRFRRNSKLLQYLSRRAPLQFSPEDKEKRYSYREIMKFLNRIITQEELFDAFDRDIIIADKSLEEALGFRVMEAQRLIDLVDEEVVHIHEDLSTPGDESTNTQVLADWYDNNREFELMMIPSPVDAQRAIYQISPEVAAFTRPLFGDHAELSLAQICTAIITFVYNNHSLLTEGCMEGLLYIKGTPLSDIIVPSAFREESLIQHLQLHFINKLLTSS